MNFNTKTYPLERNIKKYNTRECFSHSGVFFFLNNNTNGTARYVKKRKKETKDAIPDLMINLLFILALQNLREIDLKIGKSFAYGDLLEESKKRAHEAFFNQDVGLYSMTVGGNEYTVLANALAILTGLELDKEYVCEKIINGELSDCSLSMKIFKYDALLATDKEKYQEWVLNEIRREYSKMIEQGNTVWETIDGASAFDNAGSLCHGWSAIPLKFI